MTEPTSRNSATQKQAKTWLTPEQIRDACLSEMFATSLQDRNETLIVLLADTGLCVSELVALNWEYLDLDAEPGELYLPSDIQRAIQGHPISTWPMRPAGSSVGTRIASGKTARHYFPHDSLTG